MLAKGIPRHLPSAPMPTATLSREAAQPSLSFFRSSQDGDFSRNDDGTATVTDIKIFRVGTFRDSKGELHTWTAEHLAQMVANFDALRATVFPDVPVRTDHTRSAKDLVGYFSSMRTDGTFLYATLELTEPDAADKYERGTYRARSAEVGAYQDNDDAAYWPVIKGLAFVDVGAVEGLFAAQDAGPLPAINDQETSVTEAEFIAACEYAQAAAVYAQWVVDAEYAQAVADHEFTIAATYAQGIEDGSRTAAAEFAAGDKAPMVFSLAGEGTADVNRVQAHISALEGALNEVRDTNRTAFVDGLVSEHKIAAPQRDAMVELVMGQSDEQYAQFTGAYANAPAVALFAKFGDGVTNPDGTTTDEATERETLEAQVAFHRSGGMPDDQIAQLPSFKRLAVLTAEQK